MKADPRQFDLFVPPPAVVAKPRALGPLDSEPGTPNRHGVYEPTERLFLPRPIKGWQGIPLLEIEFADLGDRWLWATGLSFHTGDCWGSFSPLWDLPDRCAPTRAEALAAATAYLLERIAGRTCKEADLMRQWLASHRQSTLI